MLVAAAPTARAADTKSAWDPARTTFPATTDELKSLQESVKQVVEKTTASTVGILVGNGAGSGVIVSEDGLVLTAAHVIGWPDQDCLLILADGKRVKGKTLGVDHDSDAGMLKITDPVPKGATWPGAGDGKWPAAELAATSDVKKNQWVVSMGHPGGPKKDRRPPVRLGQFLSSFRDSATTDCTLVGGDSGGPLFELNGEVIGIHSRIGLTLDNNVHVTTNAFRKERMMEGTRVKEWDKLASGHTMSDSRNVIGVTFKRKEKDGDPSLPAEVLDVTKDGPADKAGLQVGDVVTRVGLVVPESSGDRRSSPFDGEADGRLHRVASAEAFDGAIQVIEREGGGFGRGGRGGAGPKFKIEVKRGDETKTIEVTSKRRPPPESRNRGQD